MGDATFTAGTITQKAHKVPSLAYGEVGAIVTDTTTAQWKLFDIKGLNWIHCLIENESADGAANRLDWGVIAYLDDNDSPNDGSALTVIAADTAVATTATAEFILAANAMDTTNETPVAPTIHEILPAARLQINLDAEGTDNITFNFWIVGNL